MPSAFVFIIFDDAAVFLPSYKGVGADECLKILYADKYLPEDPPLPPEISVFLYLKHPPAQ